MLPGRLRYWFFVKGFHTALLCMYCRCRRSVIIGHSSEGEGKPWIICLSLQSPVRSGVAAYRNGHTTYWGLYCFSIHPCHVCMLLPDQRQQMLGAAIRHPDNVQVPQIRHISQSLTEKFVLATYPCHVNFKAPDLQRSPLLPAGGCTFGGVHAGNVCLLQHGTLRAAVERRSCTESVPTVLQPLGSPCPRPAPR